MGAALREEFFSMTTVSKSFHRALLRNASSTAGDTNVSVDQIKISTYLMTTTGKTAKTFCAEMNGSKMMCSKEFGEKMGNWEM